MSMKEQIKFDLDILKNIFVIVLTAIFAMVGFGVANLKSLDKMQLYLGAGILFVLIVALILTIKGLVISRRKIKELE